MCLPHAEKAIPIRYTSPGRDNALCIGCGICENKRPVVDEPAIYVTSVGEVRSKTNQLLLPIIGEEQPQ